MLYTLAADKNVPRYASMLTAISTLPKICLHTNRTAHLLPALHRTCHSKLRHMLYGMRLPYNERMLRSARTHASACEYLPRVVWSRRDWQCWSMRSSKPRRAGAAL